MDQIYESVRHFTYFHPFETLGIAFGILALEIAVIGIRLSRKFKGGR